MSAPASQESFISSQSLSSSLGSRLQPSSSSLSQFSHSTQPTNGFSQDKENATGNTRVRTPEAPAEDSDRSGPEQVLVSPLSVTSPVSINGTKRTASGHVKTVSMSSMSALNGDGSRRASVSSNGSRAGEIAANLKARLGYAMAKVQNGWEHRNIVEVEQLAANKARHSMTSMDYRKRRPTLSAMSNGTARLSIQEPYALEHPMSPPSKRHSGGYAGFMDSQAQQHQYQHHINGTNAPRLQPAADIRPTTNGSSRSHHPSRPSPSQIPYTGTSAMSPPRTPINGQHNANKRPGVLRTETQTAQAERDALDALFQLGSPHVSSQTWQHAASAPSQAPSSSQASPLPTATRARCPPTLRRAQSPRRDSVHWTACRRDEVCPPPLGFYLLA
ncbi:hypothetical protein K431DRAFT_319307 [Polychaeton citri CBS 116435]|uniref:Uncharacterized protein n=1 Tax=Polychaeton citri CBS 116435 TaxID=1314669 RepID=A0A9P4QBG1_9PEZI|nr:hypothetical protein K431DRAFT_319307 [Polychaeton citri CBS 116435]